MLHRKYQFYITVMSLLFMNNVLALELLSPAFKLGENIPKQYTCDGSNISPPLFWKDAPPNTKSFVLIMDDPDAPSGTWDHWIIYNIPANINALEENMQQLPLGAVAGKNSWGHLKYGGPCPPDREHRYFFKLYAIDTTLSNNLSGKQEIENAIKDHTVASTELMTKYQRSK